MLASSQFLPSPAPGMCTSGAAPGRGGRGGIVLFATGGNNCLPAKTACGAPSKPQHTTIKECKKALTILLCLTGPYAPAAYFLSTMRTLPTKLVGDLSHTPINTPIKAICKILIFLYIHYIPTPQQICCCGHHHCNILLLSPKPRRLCL